MGTCPKILAGEQQGKEEVRARRSSSSEPADAGSARQTHLDGNDIVIIDHRQGGSSLPPADSTASASSATAPTSPSSRRRGQSRPGVCRRHRRDEINLVSCGLVSSSLLGRGRWLPSDHSSTPAPMASVRGSGNRLHRPPMRRPPPDPADHRSGSTATSSGSPTQPPLTTSRSRRRAAI